MAVLRNFTDDNAKECDACGRDITAGHHYRFIKFNSEIYRCCDKEECMKTILFDLFSAEFREAYIKTAEDKFDDWIDAEYDRER